MAFHIENLKKAINHKKQITFQMMYPNFWFCKYSHYNYTAELFQVWLWKQRGLAEDPGEPTTYYLCDIE